MIKIREIIQKTARDYIGKMVDGDAREWPPTCMVFAYQPMRPIQQVTCQQADCQQVAVDNSSAQHNTK